MRSRASRAKSLSTIRRDLSPAYFDQRRFREDGRAIHAAGGAHIFVEKNQVMFAGDVLAKIPRENDKRKTSPAVFQGSPNSSRRESRRSMHH